MHESSKEANNQYLLEIGLEEMPAGMILPAVEQLKKAAEKSLESNRLQSAKVQPFSSPRRLALLISELPEKQEDRIEELKGPPASIARDQDGAWSKAALGFAKKNGIEPDSLEVRNFDGRDYLYTAKNVQGASLKDILKQEAPEWIKGLNFPKNMRWGDYKMRFARPIRWLVSLWNQEVIHFSLEMVEAGKHTLGHRFLSPKPSELLHAQDYHSHLHNHFVEADFNNRRNEILSQIRELESKHDCKVEIADDLLEEVTNLVEWPQAMMGSYDENFLGLPESVLVTSMAVHQRYFPVYSNQTDSGGNKLLPQFIAIRNGNEQHLETVCQGNERVLRARLSDARFFYEEDQKKPLQHFQELLERVVFFQKRGSQHERVQRIQTLSLKLGEMLQFNEEELQKVKRIAELCKFDLQTQMVYEFPELQGMMGEVYSALKGEESQVSRGIREHYFPRTSGDSLPSDQVTLPVALADRMDMLSVAFSLKMIPSGSADPFALRRMAQGVVQIVLGKQLPLGWEELSSLSVQILRDQQEFTNEPDILEKQLVDFLDQRERWYLQEKGFRHDLIDAVLKPTSGTPLNRLNFASTLSEDLNLPEFKKSVEAVVRAINITNKYAEESQAAKLEEASLTHEAELALYQALEAMALDSESSPQQYLKTLYQLESSITAFFDGVMVMDENPILRSNRLALCNRLSQWSSKHLDLREIIFPGD